MANVFLRLLSTDQLQSVHEAALAILERTGMQIDHADARDILAGAGAKVDVQTNRVRFPPQLVEEKLRLVPRTFTYHGRTPEFDFDLTVDGPIYSRVAGGATGYLDFATGGHRRARIDDWKEFAILADALPNIHSIATLHCGDVPAATADIYSLRTLLENQRNCILHNAFSLENQRYLIEMMLAVRGTREELERRPLVHHQLSPISPLQMQEDDTAQLLLACEYGIPTDIPIMPIAGATAPITLAGTVAQGLAEFLGTMTLAQCARPGHRMPFFIDPVVADMRTGSALVGAPETAMIAAAIQQLGTELYGLPAQGIGLTSDGYDYGQALFQRGQMAVFQVMSGGKLIIGAGVVDSLMSIDPAQLVIDDEIMVVARRWARGMMVDRETLAVDAIDRVGPRGQFLDDEHTLDFLRTGELIDSELFERESREIWASKGSKKLEEKAREKARAILATHEVPPLSDDILREMAAIVARADATVAGARA